VKCGLVVEDLAATRRWLGEALQAAFPGIAVKSAASRAEGLALLAEPAFDVALVDIDLPDGSGLDVIAALRERMPRATSIVTTIFDDDAHVFPAMLAGAQGYLLKEQPREQFVAGLQGILRGEPPLSPAIARRMIAHFNSSGLAASGAEVTLTARETEVLRLVAKGTHARGDRRAAGPVAAHHRRLHQVPVPQAERLLARRGRRRGHAARPGALAPR
jgi:DNA-binding NarL/FixJ family response regulator